MRFKTRCFSAFKHLEQFQGTVPDVDLAYGDCEQLCADAIAQALTHGHVSLDERSASGSNIAYPTDWRTVVLIPNTSAEIPNSVHA